MCTSAKYSVDICRYFDMIIGNNINYGSIPLSCATATIHRDGTNIIIVLLLLFFSNKEQDGAVTLNYSRFEVSSYGC